MGNLRGSDLSRDVVIRTPNVLDARDKLRLRVELDGSCWDCTADWLGERRPGQGFRGRRAGRPARSLQHKAAGRRAGTQIDPAGELRLCLLGFHTSFYGMDLCQTRWIPARSEKATLQMKRPASFRAGLFVWIAKFWKTPASLPRASWISRPFQAGKATGRVAPPFLW